MITEKFCEAFRAMVADKRAATGMTQKELSEMIGVTRSQIANYENSGLFSLESVLKLCVVFDLKIDSIIYGCKAELEYKHRMIGFYEKKIKELRE